MFNLKSLTDKFSSWLLIGTGMVGVTLAVANFAGWDKLIIASSSSLAMILGSIALISLSLGVERILHFQSISSQIDGLKSLLSKSSNAQHLKGYDEIYDTAIRLCGSADRQIRSLVFNTQPTGLPKTPQNVAQAFARHLRDSRNNRKPVNFEAVVAINFGFAKSTDLKPIKERYKLYEKFGVTDLYTLRLLDSNSPVGLDIYIVDRLHVALAFTIFEGTKDLQRGLLFENQPELASEFADWFDQQISRRAVPLSKWLKEYKGEEVSD